MELITDVINQLQAGFKKLPEDDINNHNIFVYYESQITLKKFRAFCRKYENNKTPVTLKFLNELENIISGRWPNIAHTPAAYDSYDLNRVETSANIYCAAVAKIFVLSANKIDYKPRSEKKLLMPPSAQNLDIPKAYENLIQSVINDLKEYPDINRELAESIDIDMKYIARRLMDIIDNIDTIPDNQVETDLFVLLESKHTILKVKELLQKTLNNDEPFTYHQLEPFVKLLEDRWSGINGTSVSYQANPNTKVNKICRSLASYLSLMCFRTNYLNKDPESLLMPTPKKNLDQKTGYCQLQEYVCHRLETREALVAEMRDLNRADWNKYIDGFKLEKLTSLITNKQTMDTFFQAKDTYTEDEMRSSILLFCNYDIYKKGRITQPYHTTLAGALFQYMRKIYNIDDKLAAVSDAQQTIMDDKWANFRELLDDADSELSKHKGALLDSELKKFTEEVFKAIEKLHQKKEERVNIPKALHF